MNVGIGALITAILTLVAWILRQWRKYKK